MFFASMCSSACFAVTSWKTSTSMYGLSGCCANTPTTPLPKGPSKRCSWTFAAAVGTPFVKALNSGSLIKIKFDFTL